MITESVRKNYKGEVRDRLENFNGKQLVYVGWDKHLMFCSAFTFLVEPEMTFGELIQGPMAEVFSAHPEWAKIDWKNVFWLLDEDPIQPQLGVSLKGQGVGHKSLLRFQTPELKGYKGLSI